MLHEWNVICQLITTTTTLILYTGTTSTTILVNGMAAD